MSESHDSKVPDRESPFLLDLVQKSRNGDKKAMESLYETYKNSIYSLAFRYTYDRTAAEDLLHDIFIKVFNNIHRLDNNEAFVGWMYRVAVNTCLSYLRSIRKHRRSMISMDDLWQEAGGDSGRMSDQTIMSIPLERAIHNLSPKLKSIFLLHDVQGYKHREIAQMLGLSIGTSKSQLFKARMKIRQDLERKHSSRGNK